MLTNMTDVTSLDNRVRVFHTNENIALILLKNYQKHLLAVEEELNLVMECPKLDIVYVPSMNTRTLTKWTIIALNEEMSPVEQSIVHSLEFKEIQKEIARTVYQMFFGQLVSPEWWTNQWITLGLARYFSGVSEHLDFNAEKEFVVDTVQMVIREHIPFPRTWLEGDFYSSNEINNPDYFVLDQRGK